VATARRNENGVVPWPAIEGMVRGSRSGIAFIAAPVRSREAAQAIEQAEHLVVPTLASRADIHVVADVGRWTAAEPWGMVLTAADTVVLTHLQDRSSAAAATVRLERLAESAIRLGSIDVRLVVAVIGDQPFDGDQISRFVDGEIAAAAMTPVEHWHLLPHDPLAAAVLAGRAGVSEKRLARLPLMRSAAVLARLVGSSAPRPSAAASGRQQAILEQARR
jgi:hypothetical protein